MTEQALSDVVVLDLSQSIAGGFCTRLLAGCGAQVIKVERPGRGDPTRSLGPFYKDDPHPEQSALYHFLHGGKRSVTLDLPSPFGQETVRRLAKEADVLVESCAPGTLESLGLGYDRLEPLNPALVWTSITPFGSSGPYAPYKADSMALDALGGYIYINGDEDRQPARMAGPQAEYVTGAHGYIGTLAALEYRAATGLGQRVEVSGMESMAALHYFLTVMYTYEGEIKRRSGNRYFRGSTTIFPCKDGYIHLSLGGPQNWELFCDFVGMPELVKDARFETSYDRYVNWRELEDALRPALMQFTQSELFQALQELRVLAGSAMTLEQLLHDPQYNARGYWVELDHPVTGRLTYPGAPFILEETPWQPRRAPTLGEHNQEVYCQRLGYSTEDLARLRATGLV
ncbi:MAG: CoA transferase [Chloroflexi bacterium]|nr:CoA transferase [Chloroflexota bacterium]